MLKQSNGAEQMTLKDILEKYSNHPDFIGLTISGPNDKGAVDDTLMHIVSRKGTFEEMRILIDSGGDVNAVGDMSCTPLHYAVRHGQDVDMISLLLSAGANPHTVDEFGDTSVDCARKKGRGDILEVLLSS